jgi:polar amino acid transport system ATP-binding protein
MPPTAGRVVLDDEPLDYSSRKSVRAARDKMAIVFQQYNLFQNMDVLRNLATQDQEAAARAG